MLHIKPFLMELGFREKNLNKYTFVQTRVCLIKLTNIIEQEFERLTKYDQLFCLKDKNDVFLYIDEFILGSNIPERSKIPILSFLYLYRGLENVKQFYRNQKFQPSPIVQNFFEFLEHRPIRH